MLPAVLRALEFDRIREVLAREAHTPLGRARALALEPATDPGEVAAGLELTSEARAFLRAGGSLAIRAPEDLEDILATLEIEQQPLEPLRLVALAAFLRSVEEVASGVRTRPGRLRDLAAGAASFADEAARVTRAIEPSGEISDDASPVLREIRDKLRRQRGRLRASLEALTRDRDTSRYLQDQIITDRNGRYVLVVRAEHRDAVPGLVHGSSASGASLYLEPLATVSLNNEVIQLAEREQAEVARVLLALTDAFRLRRDELVETVRAAADLDEVAAKAHLADRCDGIAPELTSDGRVEFRGARHPLLIPSIRERAADGPVELVHPVASDWTLVPPAPALVISGPNTGGKTVALKGIGLLAVMAQSGLPVPAEPGSRFTPFRSIFADIGDEQSIAASLSTFSARIANLVAMDRALITPALVLLDELGGGTDPVEGGALGAAVVDHFRRRGALVVATTHDDALKSYAATTEGVAAAAFGFNPETYAPTYRLVYGAPGRSLAIEIAERLGMPPAVIADARARRSGRESQLSAHLARVDRELVRLEQERQGLQEEREALAAERQRLLAQEARVAEREAVLKRRLDDRLNEKLREARAEVDRVVGRLREKADALAQNAVRRAGRGQVLSTGELGGLRTEARAALAAIGDAAGIETVGADRPRLDAPPPVGAAVFVPALGTTGQVREVSGQRVEVEVRGKRMRVALSDLRSAGGSDVPDRKGARPTATRAPRPAPGADRSSAVAPVAREIVLVGATVDQAIDRLDKFIDDALLADERRLRVVHGHGTGRLRDAVRTFLRQHPLIASVAPAADNEGGEGATVAEIKE
jgi:DNA mismatch repair protein MutS2